MTQNKTAQDKQSLKDLKAMVVDDSKTILRSAEIYLQKLGCQVLTAEDGFASLSLIASFKPDVIFLDIMMPRLDGYQTCAIIKSNSEYASVPVIMLSSKNNLFDKARGRLAGSEEYITKPFTENDLKNVLGPYVKDKGLVKVSNSENVTKKPKLKNKSVIEGASANKNVFSDVDLFDDEAIFDLNLGDESNNKDMGFQFPSIDKDIADKSSTKITNKPSISLMDIDITK